MLCETKGADETMSIGQQSVAFKIRKIFLLLKNHIRWRMRPFNAASSCPATVCLGDTQRGVWGFLYCLKGSMRNMSLAIPAPAVEPLGLCEGLCWKCGCE